ASRAMTLAGACFSKRARIASHIVLPSRLIIGRVYANTLKGLALNWQSFNVNNQCLTLTTLA
ncbi:hypothetical protein, partial [Azotobacter chroococcum]|uniref:hypothetical protein n=1 Tax=Azotobacter chroococcum TaxID=353 RepID=UPI001B8C1ED0